MTEKELEKLYRKEYEALMRYALVQVKSKELAQDLVQDTFHELMNKRTKLADHPNQGGWLMETLKNKIKTYKRTRARYLERFVPLDAELLDESIPFPEEQLELNEVVCDLKKKLSEEDYYLFDRIVFQDASHLEVSKELGITVWASQKRLERIRRELEKDYPERKRKSKKMKFLCQFLILTAMYLMRGGSPLL